MDRLFYKTKITKVINDYNYIIGIINREKRYFRVFKRDDNWKWIRAFWAFWV